MLVLGRRSAFHRARTAGRQGKDLCAWQPALQVTFGQGCGRLRHIFLVTAGSYERFNMAAHVPL